MRRKRVKVESGAYYHLVSRCALKQYLLEEEEKRVFVGMLRRVADFSGVEVLTHCVMSNHFHILGARFGTAAAHGWRIAGACRHSLRQ
jgi:Transposase IS200 like.